MHNKMMCGAALPEAIRLTEFGDARWLAAVVVAKRFGLDYLVDAAVRAEVSVLIAAPSAALLHPRSPHHPAAPTK